MSFSKLLSLFQSLRIIHLEQKEDSFFTSPHLSSHVAWVLCQLIDQQR